jgi:hypothetical protein
MFKLRISSAWLMFLTSHVLLVKAKDSEVIRIMFRLPGFMRAVFVYLQAGERLGQVLT